jgi:hypothetical protein
MRGRTSTGKFGRTGTHVVRPAYVHTYTFRHIPLRYVPGKEMQPHPSATACVFHIHFFRVRSFRI